MSKPTNILAALLLVVMFALLLGSSWNDAPIFDETAHIGAAYSYVTQKDMRLNPEHPPLVKDLAGIAMLPLKLTFRTDTKAWRDDINGQWDQGRALLFEFGNNPDHILRYARFPIMLLAIILGIILFRWVRKLYGNGVALLALFLYAFSPTAIAHARFVTTDIAATFGFLIGIASFVRFIEQPTARRLVIAGLCFGIAQLLKFSLFLLIPIDIILALIWLFTDNSFHDNRLPGARFRLLFKNALSMYLKIAGIFLIGVAIIWTVYLWHVWDYPQEKQQSDALSLTSGFRVKPFISLDLWLIKHAPTRPLGQYLLGVMMVSQRTAGGNSAYFIGQVSSKGWWYYFPTVYLLKETLALHILSVLAIMLLARRIIRARKQKEITLREWIRSNFALFSSMFFVAFYWISSVVNPLNIGVRHVLPTFPFIYFFVAHELILWIRGSEVYSFKSIKSWLRALYHTLIAPLPRLFFVSLMLLWIAASIIEHFPYYLSYYNEIVGAENGYQYATDSNYDWGQDLKRLSDFAHTHPTETIYLDYFGGGVPSYYLGAQYKPWYSSFGPPPPGSIFAVSANSIQGNQAQYLGDMHINYDDTYGWLRNQKPFGRAGSSIFLYKIL